MGERKVLNKYYPPDFDPSKLPKIKKEENFQYVVRLMAPFTMRCLTCGEYVYKGKKFNARKETAVGEKLVARYKCYLVSVGSKYATPAFFNFYRACG